MVELGGGVDKVAAAGADHHVDWDGDWDWGFWVGGVGEEGLVDGLEGAEGGAYAACGVVGAELEAGCAGEGGEVRRRGVEDCYFEHCFGMWGSFGFVWVYV